MDSLLIITPVTHDLGAFTVRRTLPARTRTMVGPFIFVDQFGPARLDPGSGMDVRPHPHINLSTVTYLFEGAIGHRDSLGRCRGRPDDADAACLRLGDPNGLHAQGRIAIAGRPGIFKLHSSKAFKDLERMPAPEVVL